MRGERNEGKSFSQSITNTTICKGEREGMKNVGRPFSETYKSITNLIQWTLTFDLTFRSFFPLALASEVARSIPNISSVFRSHRANAPSFTNPAPFPLCSTHSGVTMWSHTEIPLRNFTVRVTRVATMCVHSLALSVTTPPSLCTICGRKKGEYIYPITYASHYCIVHVQKCSI